MSYFLVQTKDIMNHGEFGAEAFPRARQSPKVPIVEQLLSLPNCSKTFPQAKHFYKCNHSQIAMPRAPSYAHNKLFFLLPRPHASAVHLPSPPASTTDLLPVRRIHMRATCSTSTLTVSPVRPTGGVE